MTTGRPVRTCVGCREQVPAADLLRCVLPAPGSTEIIPDPRHRLPGRGAYIHRNVSCLDRAEKRRAFGKALRVSGTVDISSLIPLVSEQVA